MYLPEIPGTLANPTTSSLGATQGGLLLVTLTSHSAVKRHFFAIQRKVTRAKRETLFNSEAGKRSRLRKAKIKIDDQP